MVFGCASAPVSPEIKSVSVPFPQTMESLVLCAFSGLVENWATKAWRIVHWGPAFGIATMTMVILTSTHFFVQLFFPLQDLVSLFLFAIGCTLVFFAVYSYIAAILDGPGFVPIGWRPAKRSDGKHLLYCDKCKAFKAPRSHHCSSCQRCVLKMDHHCVWLNGCMGFANQRSFFFSLLIAVIGASYSLAILTMTLYRVIHFIPNDRQQYVYLSMQGLFFIILVLVIDLFALFAFGSLLLGQLRIMLTNQTSIERLLVKAAEARQRKLPFVYPYNLGLWANIYQVFFDDSLDGITWPVREGCHPYTLTDEQLEQKKELMEKASLYRIIDEYTGNYLPFFSQGLWITLNLPWSSKKRMAVELGDRILVTEKRSHWLYGFKENSKPQEEGWLPCRCALFVQKQSERKKENPTTNFMEMNESTKNTEMYDLESDSDVSSDFSLSELVESILEDNEKNEKKEKKDG